jgi:hypothetical protein
MLMKKIITTGILFIIFSSFSAGQLKSVTLFTDYSSSLTKRMEVTRADAVGGGVKAKISVWENLSVLLSGGFRLYSVNEPGVLNSWNWEFWTARYYTKIVSDLNADPNLSVNISGIQKMDIIPLILELNYDIVIGDNLIISPSGGSGIYFYKRRLFAQEDWTKNFPAAGYRFDYSFRNFAPDKKGNPLVVVSGLSIEYKIAEMFNVSGSAGYNYIVPTEHKMGYDAFPFENELSFKLGLSIIY